METKEASAQLFKIVIDFVTESNYEMMEYGIDSKDLRIAIPTYLERLIIEGMYNTNYYYTSHQIHFTDKALEICPAK